MDQKQQARRFRVVVAEDNDIIRETLAEQLIELGHTVAGKARDGAEVVEVVGQVRPDAVIIDRGLPVQDGVAAIRAIAASSPTAVILFSAYMSEGDPEEEARAIGAHAFLEKPHLMEQLNETLERAVRRFQE